MRSRPPCCCGTPPPPASRCRPSSGARPISTTAASPAATTCATGTARRSSLPRPGLRGDHALRPRDPHGGLRHARRRGRAHLRAGRAAADDPALGAQRTRPAPRARRRGGRTAGRRAGRRQERIGKSDAHALLRGRRARLPGRRLRADRRGRRARPRARGAHHRQGGPRRGGLASGAAPRPRFPRRDRQRQGVLDVRRDRPGALVASAPVRAVVLPRVGEGPERWCGGRPRRRACARSRPARSCSTSVSGGTGIATVAELLRRVPVYGLELGPPTWLRPWRPWQRLARGLAP